MQITNQHIFDELTRLRLEIKADMSELKGEVDNNTNWRNQIAGKLTVLFIAIGIGVNFIVDWGRSKLHS